MLTYLLCTYWLCTYLLCTLTMYPRYRLNTPPSCLPLRSQLRSHSRSRELKWKPLALRCVGWPYYWSTVLSLLCVSTWCILNSIVVDDAALHFYHVRFICCTKYSAVQYSTRVLCCIIRRGLAVLCIIRIICIILYNTVLRIHIPCLRVRVRVCIKLQS